jgi:predicted membrane-bound mannosyltransferase/DNA-binding beta-propeller fold protein YncE
METQDQVQETWLSKKIPISIEFVVFIALLLIALFTRFVDLESRVMSHDESLHTQFSWYLAEGRGFSHDPLMHGPLQMHLVAFSYFLFGDSDASARIPAALASVIAVVMVFLFRRWLGKWGGLAATALMTASPYMLYYGRYVRNEALVVPIALLMFYAVFQYYETRKPQWLYALAASLALHATAKETSFIYTAQLLIFLGAFFGLRLLRKPWKSNQHKYSFLFGFSAAALGIFLALGALFQGWAASGEVATGQASIDPTTALAEGLSVSPLVAFGAVLAIGGFILMAYGLLATYGRSLRDEFPDLDLLVVTATLTLPQLAALLTDTFGWPALEYRTLFPLGRTTLIVIVLLLISAGVGAIWNWRKWLVSAGVFYALFLVFYTTLFTNENGLVSGLVGSLGYWIEQHGVQRGGQPLYYYLFVQIPIYEYLPAIGSIIALVYWLRGVPSTTHQTNSGEEPADRFPVVSFLAYWSITSLAAYSFAGEKMPWLTVHIALPMIIFGGWGIGEFLRRMQWDSFAGIRGWVAIALMLTFIVSFLRAVGILLGTNPPFQGNQLDQLRSTSLFFTALLFIAGSAYGYYRLQDEFRWSRIRNVCAALILALTLGLTFRTAVRASLVNYDLATEYLVYAHAAPGVKTAMQQIEDLSIRTTDGKAIRVAYDDDVSWPLNWYLRDYKQQYFFGANPTRDLLEYPVILVGDNNWSAVEPLLADRFNRYEYIRMWWPNQDYWNLKRSAIEAERNFEAPLTDAERLPMGFGEYLIRAWGHIKPFFTDSRLRVAIWDIWIDRDFQRYSEWAGRDMSLPRWSPSDRMRLYIRKDIAAMVWDYGITSASINPPVIEDPYEDKFIDLSADLMIGKEGLSPGEFFRPRDLAISPDGTIYVVDTANHRVQHLSPSGEVLHVWGSYADVASGDAPGGTFNEPWGIAISEQGRVYVADTWNHRIQWFSAEGEFLGMLGREGLGEEADTFWGPRDVVVDSDGRVYVSDTGNKRIKVFDQAGNFIVQFGGAGYLPGFLDEPVGLAVDRFDRVFIADTWNQRIQVFDDPVLDQYSPVFEWTLDSWYGQSLENKPYLGIDERGVTCTSDPEGFRILCFDLAGEFLVGWGGSFGSEANQFNILSGIDIAESGDVWVVDSGNHRIMRFQPNISLDS